MTSPFPADSPKDSANNSNDNVAGTVAADHMLAEIHAVNTLAAGTSARHIAPPDTDQATAAPQQYNHDGFIGALVQNASYTGVQQSVKSLAQLGDRVAGSHTADHVNLVAKPLAAEYKSAEWYGEQFGGAVGKVAPFLLAFAATRGASTAAGLRVGLEAGASVGLESAGESAALLSRKNLILAGQTTVAGFGSEAVFTPNEKSNLTLAQFTSERLKNGAIGALDMAAITAGTLSLKSLGVATAKDSPLASALLRNSAVGAAISGYPTGLVSAEAHSRLFDGRSSTAEEREQSALGMAVVGFGLGALHGQAEASAGESNMRAKSSQLPGIADVLKSHANRALAHGDNLMAAIMPDLSGNIGLGGNRLAFAYAEGRTSGRAPLRTVAMESTIRDLNSNIMYRDGDKAFADNKPSNRSGRASRSDRVLTPDLQEKAGTARDAEPTKPVSLKKSLTDLHLAEVADFVGRDKVLKHQTVVRSLGDGNDSPAVLELAPSKAFPEGGALKVTIAEGGWQRNWGNRSFDALLLTKVHEVDMEGSHFSGSANVYVQELVDTQPRYSQDLVDNLFAQVHNSGLEFGDPGSDITKQVGISRKSGNLVLIDYPSVDRSGSHETLQALIGGHEAAEAGYEKENQAIRDGKNDADTGFDDIDHRVFDAEKEALKGEALHAGQFNAREQELLSQLQQGISQKEVLEFAAILDGKFNAKGMPDTKAVRNQFDAMVRRAQTAGVLEKPGKQSKMSASSDDGYGDLDDQTSDW